MSIDTNEVGKQGDLNLDFMVPNGWSVRFGERISEDFSPTEMFRGGVLHDFISASKQQQQQQQQQHFSALCCFQESTSR